MQKYFRINLTAKFLFFVFTLPIFSEEISYAEKKLDSEIYCENISFESSGRVRLLEICCDGKKPGIMLDSETGQSFMPLQRKLRIARLLKKRHQIKKLKSFLKAGRDFCSEISPLLPTPAPSATVTPIVTSIFTPVNTPTNTPLPNIDEQGNVTAKGKECFEIPSQLAANTETGELLVTQKCVNCHGTLLLDVNGAVLYDRPFPFVRTRIAVSPMNFDSQDVPDGDLAHIVAFLNRFRPVNCQ